MAKTIPTLIQGTGASTGIPEPLAPKVSQRFTINDRSSTRNTTDFTNIIVEITPTVDCCFKLGSSTVTAKSGEDYFCPAYATKVLNTEDYTRVAAQAYNSGEFTGIMFITEKA